MFVIFDGLFLNYLFLQHSVFSSSSHFPLTLSQKNYSIKFTEVQVRTLGSTVIHLKAGAALAELVNTWHCGKNEGTTEAEIIVFYAGIEGKANTIYKEMDTLTTPHLVTKTELLTVSQPLATFFNQ